MESMRIVPFNQAPLLQTDTVCSPSALWLAFGIALTLLFPFFGAIAVRNGAGAFGWWFLIWGVAIGGFYIWFGGRRLVRTLAGRAWLIRWNPRHLVIRLGEVFEQNAATLAALELDWADIQWIRRVRSTTISDAGRETQASRTTYLQIQLRVTELDALRQKLSEVRKPKVWHGWSATREVPVSLGSDGLLCVEWHGRNSWITPSLRRILPLLAERGLTVKEAVDEVNDFTVSAPDKKKMEDEILRLAQSGDTIAAIRLARKRYGYPLAQAKEFVDGLSQKA